MTIDVRDEPVLVTGGTGFLGRYVVAKLEERGARVTAVGSGDYDLTEPGQVQAALSDVSPRYVVHAAAVVGGIGANRARPAAFFYENAVMGIHLIHEAWRAGVEKLVIIGTVCSYPRVTPVPFVEADFWNGYPEETNAPYGIAKKALIVQSQAYRDEHGFNSVCVVPTNLYGPGDNFDPATSHVIPAMIRKFVEAHRAAADSVVLWGSGEPTREFLYVEEAAEAIVRALERYESSAPVNLGAGKEISIKELAELIRDVVGYRGRITWDRSKPDGQPRRMVSGGRAQVVLDWTPTMDLREGLGRTLDAWIAADTPEPSVAPPVDREGAGSA